MTVTLPNKALEFLKQALADTGWNKSDDKALTLKRFYIAAKMLVDVLPEQEDAPVPPGKIELEQDPAKGRTFVKENEAWALRLAKPFDVSDKELDVVQFCLKHIIHEDRMPKGLPGLRLMEAFKLLPE